MKKLLPTNSFCSTYGHNYFLIEKLKEKSSEIICKCCEKKFFLTNQGDIIGLSLSSNEINILLDYLDYQENNFQRKTA